MGVLQRIRGFSTNVANYQMLGEAALCPAEAFHFTGTTENGAAGGVAEWCKGTGARTSGCCTADPCHVLPDGSGGSTELTYVQTLQKHFIRKTGWAPRFVIDTGRNGAASDPRRTCESWCNVRGAGAGHAATLNTHLPGVVDAFFWLKTPGESDGCTHELPDGAGSCARFDSTCGGGDAIGSAAGEPRSPEAGLWFDYQAKMLARNAHLGLNDEGTLDAMWGSSGEIKQAQISPELQSEAPRADAGVGIHADTRPVASPKATWQSFPSITANSPPPPAASPPRAKPPRSRFLSPSPPPPPPPPQLLPPPCPPPRHRHSKSPAQSAASSDDDLLQAVAGVALLAMLIFAVLRVARRRLHRVHPCSLDELELVTSSDSELSRSARPRPRSASRPRSAVNGATAPTKKKTSGGKKAKSAVGGVSDVKSDIAASLALSD